jgi:uncharacterized membrane protein
MLHTYCDVVEQITVRLAPYVAIATNRSPSSLRHAAPLFSIIIIIITVVIMTVDIIIIVIIIIIIIHNILPFWKNPTDYLNTATILLQVPSKMHRIVFKTVILLCYFSSSLRYDLIFQHQTNRFSIF